MLSFKQSFSFLFKVLTVFIEEFLTILLHFLFKRKIHFLLLLTSLSQRISSMTWIFSYFNKLPPFLSSTHLLFFLFGKSKSLTQDF